MWLEKLTWAFGSGELKKKQKKKKEKKKKKKPRENPAYLLILKHVGRQLQTKNFLRLAL
jgi:hypothetical protein